MAKRSIEESTLTALADKVRAKTGTSDALTLDGTILTALDTLPDKVGGEDRPTTMGQRACLARAAQMRDIVYTPVGSLPYNYGEYAAGESIQGITYSSVRQTDKFIGFNVSLHTFMTALHNPRSVLYTKTATGSIAKTWYGMNCSVFVSYALDWLYHTATDAIPYLDYLEEYTDTADMKLCDVLNCAKSLGGAEGHTVLVTGITRDEHGDITAVEITEANSIKVAAKEFTLAAFIQYYITERGYKLYRDKRLYKTSYKASPYVQAFADEPAADIVYSDLCTDLGDKATINKGESITLQPLVTEGYTAIKLYKNGVEFAEYDVADVVLTDLEAGRYTATLVPEAENASASFIVTDVWATVDGNRCSFGGVGGTPIRAVFKNSTGYTLAVTDFTEEDIAQGYKVVEYTSDDLAQICVPFKNEYGFVVVKATEAIPDIPIEYQKVSYVETDGNQYIDTGVLASDHADGITYGLSCNITGKMATSKTDFFFGATDGANRSGYIGIAHPATDTATLVLNAGANGENIQKMGVDVGHDLQLTVTASATTATTATATLNGTAFNENAAATNSTAEPEKTIWLFACNGISGDTRRFLGKLYSFTMTAADGTPIRNFVPCYRKSDNVIGLYDTVGGVFYTNSGTGAFAKGTIV